MRATRAPVGGRTGTRLPPAARTAQGAPARARKADLRSRQRANHSQRSRVPAPRGRSLGTMSMPGRRAVRETGPGARGERARPVSSGTTVPPRELKSPTEPAPPLSFADASPQGRDALREVPLRSAPRPSLLAARIDSLRGAGPKLAAAAGEMGLDTVGDVLLHVPHSYRDRAAPRKLGELRIGEEATVEVEVRSARVRPTRRRGLVIVEASVADDSGPAKAVWFNQAWLVDRLTEGTRLLLFGKLDRSGFRVEAHEVLGGGGAGPATGIHTTGIVPVHPASERVRAQRLREWAWQARPPAGPARWRATLSSRCPRSFAPAVASPSPPTP